MLLAGHFFCLAVLDLVLGHLIYGLSVWAFTAVLTVRCFRAAFAGILVGVLVCLAGARSSQAVLVAGGVRYWKFLASQKVTKAHQLNDQVPKAHRHHNL